MAKSSWDWNAFRLAVIEAGTRGELTAEWRAANPDVEPAHVLLERIAEEKAELIRTKQIRKEKPLPPISAEEVPFDIPDGWEWSWFLGLLRQLSGKIPRGLKTKEILASGLYPVVSQAAEASVGWSNDKSILVDFDLPLVLFGDHSRTVKLIETPFVIGADGLKLLKPHRGIEPEYLFRMLQTFKFDVASYGRHFSQLTAAVFPVPPICEQQEIVRILSALDSGESDGPVHPVVARIQKLEQEFRALASEYESQDKWLTDLRSALLQEAISGQLTADWRTANPDVEPAHVLLERIAEEKAELIRTKQIRKEKPLPPIAPDEVPFDIPSTWVLSHLGSLCRSISDGAHKTPKYTEEGVRFLSIKDVSGGQLDLSNTRRISVEEHIELIKRCKPERGDILFCRIGTLGRPVVIDIDEEFSIFVSLGLLKFFPQYIKPAFLCHVLDSPFLWTQYMKVKATGSHTNKLNLRDIPGLLIPFPPISEQEAILEALDAQLKKLDALQEELEQSKKAAQLLMKSKLAEVFSKNESLECEVAYYDNK